MKTIKLKEETQFNKDIKYIIIDHFEAINEYTCFYAFNDKTRDDLTTENTKLIIEL